MTVRPIKFGTGRQLTSLAYAQTLADFFSHYDQVPHIQNKIKSAQETINQINQGYLPLPLTNLTIDEADIEMLQGLVLAKYPNDAVKGNAYWQELITPLEDLDETLAGLRDVLIQDFDMYSFPNSEFVAKLDNYLGKRKVLEIMAGQGYLTAGLRTLNPQRQIWATDNQAWLDQPGEHIPPITGVENNDALTALAEYASHVDVVMMSWAPDTNNIDWQVLSWLRTHEPQVELLVIGEFEGATNSTQFWQEAQLTPLDDLNISLKSFDLIDEKIYIAR